MPGTETDEKRELRTQYLEQLAHVRESYKSGRIYNSEMHRLSDTILDKIIALDADDKPD